MATITISNDEGEVQSIIGVDFEEGGEGSSLPQGDEVYDGGKVLDNSGLARQSMVIDIIEALQSIQRRNGNGRNAS